MNPIVASDGRTLIVAVDHPLYSWPCPGLEDRAKLIRSVAEAGADALIASYGTVRDLKDEAFGSLAPILKLDLTTVSLGGRYPVTDYVLAWTVDDAARLGAAAVLTFVQLGSGGELEALRAAARTAAAADRAGLPYVCEIMPVASVRFPDPTDPVAIAAACRTAAELGAHLVKTSTPSPAGAIADAVGCGVPVVLAGGDLTADRAGFLAQVGEALAAGAAGVAVGRNVWGATDPAAMVADLRGTVHGDAR